MKHLSEETQRRISRLQEACALELLVDYKYDIEILLPALDLMVISTTDPLEHTFQVNVRAHVQRLYAQHLQRLSESN